MEGFVIENGKANFETCARCGAAIKNVFWFRGQPYGSECILVVTGEPVDHWVVKNGQIDEAATAERKRDREARAAEFRAAAEAEKIAADAAAAQAKIDNAWLVEILKGQSGGFCAAMVQELESGPFTADRFSDKQAAIMADIYSRAFGRRGSKAYDAAYDEFYKKLDGEEVTI